MKGNTHSQTSNKMSRQVSKLRRSELNAIEDDNDYFMQDPNQIRAEKELKKRMRSKDFKYDICLTPVEESYRE